MSASIHIEGLGVIGSILARRLHREGVEFTWSDNHSKFNAWRASTSCVLPDGDDVIQAGYCRWLVWAQHEFADVCERVPYAFTQKHPPHGARFSYYRGDRFNVSADAEAVCVNAQELVIGARSDFFKSSRPGPEPGQIVVVAHPSERTIGYSWGWSRLVMLDLPDELPERPVIYDRRPRVKGDSLSGVMSYAYPVANYPGWWHAGSSMVKQTEPKVLLPSSHFERWEAAMAELGVTVAACETEIKQGWRPVAAEDDTEWVRFDREGRLVVRPMSHSGVKLAPPVTDRLMELLLD